jgi:hypothetical protein
MVRNIEPIYFSSTGILLKYEISAIEKKCAPDETMDTAECSLRSPSRKEHTKFEEAYSFCSTKSPVNVAELTEQNGLKGKFLANYLNPNGEIPQYQVSATFEYLAVCHGWEPKSVDDVYHRYLTALGYKPIRLAREQLRFASIQEFVASLSTKRGSTAHTLPAQLASTYFGVWAYKGSESECKHKVDESPELFRYTPTQMISAEMTCRIIQTTPRGNATELFMVCNGEGRKGIRQKETVEVVEGHLKVMSIQNGKRAIDTLSRCP